MIWKKIVKKMNIKKNKVLIKIIIEEKKKKIFFYIQQSKIKRKKINKIKKKIKILAIVK